jgi:hypothetical protein
MFRALKALAVSLLLLYSQPLAASAAQQTSSMVAQSGNAAIFALSLTADTPVVHLKDPIWVTVLIRNISAVPHDVAVGPRFDFDFNIEEQRTSHVVPRNPHNTFGYDLYVGHGGRVVPGGYASRRFRLDLMYLFSSPGIYVVEVTKTAFRVSNGTIAPVPPQAVTITVLP